MCKENLTLTQLTKQSIQADVSDGIKALLTKYNICTSNNKVSQAYISVHLPKKIDEPKERKKKT